MLYYFNIGSQVLLYFNNSILINHETVETLQKLF